MSRTFVIKINYGGLGDHLFYSHLPRIAKSLGWDRVAISTRSAYRHEAYRPLVWESNPFVDDYTDEDAPCPEFATPVEGGNLLDTLMLLRGLDDGQRWHEPEVFYQPKPRPELQQAALYDPNFVSFVGDVSASRIASILAHAGLPVHQLRPRERGYPLPLPHKLEVVTPSLTDYCDCIASSQQFYCLTSGGATLAAALGKPATAFYGFGQLPLFHHSKLHRYLDVSRPWYRSKVQMKSRLKSLLGRPR